jgi:hypothetical protein
MQESGYKEGLWQGADGWFYAYHMGWRTRIHPLFILQMMAEDKETASSVSVALVRE